MSKMAVENQSRGWLDERFYPMCGNIAKGSVAGLVGGVIVAATKGQSMTYYGATMYLNFTLTAGTFFMVKEGIYAVRGKEDATTNGISGAISGLVLGSVAGPSTALRFSVGLGLVGVFGTFAYRHFELWRMEQVRRRSLRKLNEMGLEVPYEHRLPRVVYKPTVWPSWIDYYLSWNETTKQGGEQSPENEKVIYVQKNGWTKYIPDTKKMSDDEFEKRVQERLRQMIELDKEQNELEHALDVEKTSASG